MINPWSYYQQNDPDSIPDLIQSEDDFRGCLSIIISCILSIIIFGLGYIGIFKLKEYQIINEDIVILFIGLDIFLFVGILILFCKIGFKIVDKISKKNIK